MKKYFLLILHIVYSFLFMSAYERASEFVFVKESERQIPITPQKTTLET